MFALLHCPRIHYPSTSPTRRQRFCRFASVLRWCLGLLFLQYAPALAGVQIVQLRGEVKIRRGLEEQWQGAKVNMQLEEIDTIFTGENGEAVLELGEGMRFTLGPNALLDIADLRKITTEELFLILVSEKIGKLKPSGQKTPLRLGDVSARRGEPYQTPQENPVVADKWWRWEVNGAQALAAQNLPTNAALKWHRIQEKFPTQNDCGEVSFYLAQTLEQLQQPGQARDQFQTSLQQAQAQHCADEPSQKRMAAAQRALDRQ